MSGQYSLFENSLTCKECKDGGTCPNGSLIILPGYFFDVLKKIYIYIIIGYWRPNIISENIFLCDPNVDACLYLI